jgi:sulfopyruvate decarboxylase subunit alpha
VSGAELAALLGRHGFDFFTGVPCSLVEDLIAALEHHPQAPWLPAVREDVAVGLAAGAWFGGRRPVVVMQNSGLGTSLNALASLSLMYRLPALLLVTWRGYEGKDAPEHILMGEISPHLLDLLGIPFRVLSSDSVDEYLGWAHRELDAREIPVALLVPPGVVVAAGVGGGGTTGSVTRSPESRLFEPRAGRGGPTPPVAYPAALARGRRLRCLI